MNGKKIAFISAGVVCTGLGALGAALPVLPATPFLLAASFCFVRSSPRLHGLLLKNRFLGPRLERIQTGAGLTAKEKIVIYITACAFIVPVMVLAPSLHLRLFLGLLLLVKAAVFLTMRTAAPEPKLKK
jgi:uncharacterized membrane protein YbaN (DUF454 family)